MDTLAGLKVAVLKGGPGSEREVSLRSAQTVERSLKEAGASEVIPVDVRDAGFDLPDGVDIAFVIIHGTFGEDGEIQKALELKGVKYTGEGVDVSRCAFDKLLSKDAFIAAGIPTPGYEKVAAGARPAMKLPLVVKAPREGSSVGVYIIKTEAELAPALEGVKNYAQEFLVEEYIAGRELTVGIVGDLALPIIEICPKEGFYDFRNKYPWLSPGGAADHYCPADLPEETTRKLQELALKAHRALGCQVYSRVDFILTEAGDPYVLEINTIPGMTDSSLLPEAAGVAGIALPELVTRIVNLSLRRWNA
nr:D-alanine--D-alanine ligase [uncultured bacterium]